MLETGVEAEAETGAEAKINAGQDLNYINVAGRQVETGQGFGDSWLFDICGGMR
jgi:hypothetical protein